MDESQINAEFVDKYKGRLDAIILDAIKEKKEGMGTNIYVKQWVGNEIYYIGDSFAFRVAYDWRTEKRARITKLDMFLKYNMKSHLEFLKNLTDKNNLMTINDIAKVQEVKPEDLQGVINKAIEKGISNLTDDDITIKISKS